MMTRRSKLALRSVLVAGVVLAGAAVAIQASSSQVDAGDLAEILGPNPSASATRAHQQTRDRTRADVLAAAARTRTCITDEISAAGRERAYELSVTVTDPAVVANDDDLSLNWGFTMTNGTVSEAERTNFSLIASAIEISCQRQHFDGAANAHRMARRSDRAYMNDRASAMAKCLRDDQQVNLTGKESRQIVRALAHGRRPAEPLATRVNDIPALRNAVTQCLLRFPDIAELPIRNSAG